MTPQLSAHGDLSFCSALKATIIPCSPFQMAECNGCCRHLSWRLRLAWQKASLKVPTRPLFLSFFFLSFLFWSTALVLLMPDTLIVSVYLTLLEGGAALT